MPTLAIPYQIYGVLYKLQIMSGPDKICNSSCSRIFQPFACNGHVSMSVAGTVSGSASCGYLPSVSGVSI